VEETVTAKQCLSFMTRLIEGGHTVSIGVAQGGEFRVSCSSGMSIWVGEGEELRDAIEDLSRYIYGKPNA
jgi:hypothetical protein